jgi:hypothetical protein
VSEELLVELVEQIDELVVALSEQPPDELVVTLFEAERGPKGDPGITVSSTPPENPSINDLWLQLPP